MSNTFGRILRLTSFGESHGKALGGILDGFPSGIEIDFDFINKQLQRRRPGQSRITTSRRELDKVQFLSGIFEGKSTGTPIGFVIENTNQRSGDYSDLSEVFRPSHADYTYHAKYSVRDYRGGGRTSARTTVSQVVAGALAQHILQYENIEIYAYTSSVGDIELAENYQKLDLSKIDNNIVRCPNEETAGLMIEKIENVKKQGDTIGGVVTCVIKNVPLGLGEPVFDKLHARLGAAMLNINAVKGFEIGSGFDGTRLKGSEHNDIFDIQNGQIVTKTNRSGGVQGGISNGQDIYFRVAFKPVATLLMQQETVDRHGQKTTITPKGRHDPCVVPRAVPIVEAMAALVLADFYLLQYKPKFED